MKQLSDKNVQLNEDFLASQSKCEQLELLVDKLNSEEFVELDEYNKIKDDFDGLNSEYETLKVLHQSELSNITSKYEIRLNDLNDLARMKIFEIY